MVNRIEIILFDHVLYGAVIAFSTTTWGPLWGSLAGFMAGFIIMLPLSALTCYAFICFYDWAKKDWLGIEALKQFRDAEGSGRRIRRVIMRVARLGDAPAFVVLSLYTDPFVVTMYMRKDPERYNGLKRHDWTIFWTSLLLSNGYWTLRWIVIVEVARLLWNMLL